MRNEALQYSGKEENAAARGSPFIEFYGDINTTAERAHRRFWRARHTAYRFYAENAVDERSRFRHITEIIETQHLAETLCSGFGICQRKMI